MPAIIKMSLSEKIIITAVNSCARTVSIGHFELPAEGPWSAYNTYKRLLVKLYIYILYYTSYMRVERWQLCLLCAEFSKMKEDWLSAQLVFGSL